MSEYTMQGCRPSAILLAMHSRLSPSAPSSDCAGGGESSISLLCGRVFRGTSHKQHSEYRTRYQKVHTNTEMSQYSYSDNTFLSPKMAKGGQPLTRTRPNVSVIQRLHSTLSHTTSLTWTVLVPQPVDPQWPWGNSSPLQSRGTS